MTINSALSLANNQSGSVSLSQAVAGNRPIAPARDPIIVNPGVAVAEQQTENSNTLAIVDDVTLSAKQQARVEYDRETTSQRGAIAQYLTTQHSAKREEIQQMVGIDLYA
ncbi:hypothetical protein K8B83_14440 [Shewanella inventionis]|uniref:Uncharacterized protein n=1 Tax=Shewanella inventionis TaxID=1738770 RepID=A0ABQ1J4R4_9GAMM|nr:hypothetical protein [Shewanella inventionis]MCL1157430.1 hypothetical protein [Shewanella inventionis]UAL42077.1 hypothetical protein K8B83_14440 [Shewanella inventionis]GGB58782.1 hypothetical protein GCM10011607_19270 [Shewanella inventionis]